MQKDFRFSVKSVNEEGSFVGMASVYGNRDLGGDIVEPGAFTKTLRDRGGEVPILFSHDVKQPVGLGKLKDTSSGLQVDGRLLLSVQKGREVYEMLKARVLKGLSFGYDVVLSDIKNGTRFLKELKLYEVSLVVAPMNELATVQSVKQADDNWQIERFRELIAECRRNF